MLTLALSMVLYGVLMKSTRARRLGRLQHPAPDAARPAARRGRRRLRPLRARGRGHRRRRLADRAPPPLRARARDPGHPGERAPRRVPRRLRARRHGDELRARGACSAAIGGALTVLALGHIEPTFAYWTQSGEFVFVAILAGPRSVGADLRRLPRAGARPLVLEPLLPEHLAARPRPLPPRHDPVPAAAASARSGVAAAGGVRRAAPRCRRAARGAAE